jgi:hypothetical protein
VHTHIHTQAHTYTHPCCRTLSSNAPTSMPLLLSSCITKPRKLAWMRSASCLITSCARGPKQTMYAWSYVAAYHTITKSRRSVGKSKRCVHGFSRHITPSLSQGDHTMRSTSCVRGQKQTRMRCLSQHTRHIPSQKQGDCAMHSTSCVRGQKQTMCARFQSAYHTITKSGRSHDALHLLRAWAKANDVCTVSVGISHHHKVREITRCTPLPACVGKSNTMHCRQGCA